MSVQLSHEGRVAIVVMDRPEARNAMNTELSEQLAQTYDALETDDDVWAVVVTGAGDRAFCAGADLKERAKGIVDSTSFVRAIERFGTTTAPVIAAVDGPVRAGGVGLMAACDLVVVNPAITFAFTEVRIGVAPAIISGPVLQRCGWSQLAAPYLTGEPFDAGTALRMGLVTHVSDDVAGTVAELCAGILAGGPAAVAATKQLLRAPHSMPELQQLSESMFTSEEAAEGMAAFAEKRAPRWAQ
jgi:enoyl-CoA hydratase/carnithine racemase